MRLNNDQVKQVTRWIKRNMRRFYDSFYGYDCTVAAEACGNELDIYGCYDAILREIEYYVVNKD